MSTEIPRLSPSIAKVLLDKSPKHAHAAHRLLGNAPKPDPSPAVLLGKAIDALTFGTDSVCEKVKGETYADNTIVLTPAPYKTAREVSGHVRAALDQKFGPSYSLAAQVRAEWNSPSGNVPCSAVMDLYRDGTVLELKTSHDLSDAGIVKSIELYRYDLQIAAYAEAVTTLYGVKNPTLLFLFAETQAPYDTRWITPDPRMVGNGTKDWLRAVTLWKVCIDSGLWPGRGDATLGPSQYRDIKEMTARAAEWLP